MQRLTVGVLVVIGLACAPAGAQDVPEEARKAIAQNLHGSFLVYRDKVQDDLKLSNEQKDKLAEHLKERLPDFMKFFENLGGLKGEEREKELKAFRQKAQEKLVAVLKETLKEDQGKRLRQLELQQEGPFALLHDEGIGKGLKVTEKQRKQIMAVVQEMQKKVQPLIKKAQEGGKPEEIRPKVMEVRKEYAGKIEAILSDEQKKQWQTMLGKALELDD
jgi:Spy/CpxP family protein refolding chaperone